MNAFEENNLKELKKTNPERVKYVTSLGGQASARKRKKDKAQREYLRALLDATLTVRSPYQKYFDDMLTEEEKKRAVRWIKIQRTKEQKKREQQAKQ